MDRNPQHPERQPEGDDRGNPDHYPLGVFVGAIATAIIFALALWIGHQLVRWECEVINQSPVVSMPTN